MSSNSTPKVLQSRSLTRPGVAALLAGFVVLACAGTPAHADTSAPGTIRFCVDKANPVFALDEAVGKAAAQAENMTADFVVRDSSNADQERDSGAAEVKFFTHLATSCDLIMGFPTEAAVQHLPEGMAASLPYIKTGFVTVTKTAPAGNFQTLANHYKVGVVYLTVAETYFTDANVTHEHIYDSNDELLAALNANEIDAALMWRPWLERQLVDHPQKLNEARLAMPHADWNIVALYPAGTSDAGVKKFNAGIEALRKSGKLSKITSPDAVSGPYN